jgi:hypothetical protein
MAQHQVQKLEEGEGVDYIGHHRVVPHLEAVTECGCQVSKIEIHQAFFEDDITQLGPTLIMVMRNRHLLRLLQNGQEKQDEDTNNEEEHQE